MLHVTRRCKGEAHLLVCWLQHGGSTVAKQQPLVLADVQQSAPSMLPQDCSPQHVPCGSVHDQSAPSYLKTLFQAPTSVRSSMLAGLMSTMLKLWSLVPRCHRFTRRSSALMNVSWCPTTASGQVMGKTGCYMRLGAAAHQEHRCPASM